MYRSPIELLITDIDTQIVEQQEEQIYKAVVNIIPSVDKEELLRALKYDRGQYEKGYADGERDAMNSLVRCKDCARYKKGYCTIRKDSWGAALLVGEHDFCSDGERKE